MNNSPYGLPGWNNPHSMSRHIQANKESASHHSAAHIPEEKKKAREHHSTPQAQGDKKGQIEQKIPGEPVSTPHTDTGMVSAASEHDSAGHGAPGQLKNLPPERPTRYISGEGEDLISDLWEGLRKKAKEYAADQGKTLPKAAEKRRSGRGLAPKEADFIPGIGFGSSAAAADAGSDGGEDAIKSAGSDGETKIYDSVKADTDGRNSADFIAHLRKIGFGRGSSRARIAPSDKDGRAFRRVDFAPSSLQSVLGKEVILRGWERDLAAATLFDHWADIVGPNIAMHTKVVAFKEKKLFISCDSTAWATNLRLMQVKILQAIARHVGPDLIETLDIRGPKAPSWRHGPLHVKGRGPRDTYG